MNTFKVKSIIFKEYKNNCYTYIFTTDNKKIVKCHSFCEIFKDDEITGDIEIIFDKAFGNMIYISLAKIIIDNNKQQYLQYVKRNFKGLNDEALEDLFKHYKYNIISALSNIDLAKYNIKIDDIENIKDKAEQLNKIEELRFYINFYTAYNIDFNVVLKMYNDNVSAEEIEENPYVICKYDYNTVNALDNYYYKEHKYLYYSKARTQVLIYNFLVNRFEEFGDICFPLKNIDEIIDEININNIEITKNDILDSIKDSKDFIVENECIYLKKNYFIEKDIIDNINARNKNKENEKEVNVEGLTDEQNKALNNAINKNLSLISGRPGTGKTHTIKTIAEYILNNYKNKKVLILALTGRVADKLSREINNKNENIDFMTIHRALNLNEFVDNNKLKDIDADYVIVDESSMIDINLFKYLLLHTNIKSKIILVGDYNQLSAIGGGQVFRDLCNSNKIVKTELTKIFRQNEDNIIIKNANMIIENGKCKDLKQNCNFYIIDKINENFINSVSVDCLKCFIEQRKEKIEDILILTATCNKAKKLNNAIQRKFNKTTQSTIINNKLFKLNDKVMHTKNNNELKVYNGNVGKVIRVFEDRIIVKFNNKEVEYDKDNIKDLTLAYAITVHKAQGTEAKNVFVVLDKNDKKILNKNLIYTATTRAKSTVAIIAREEIIDYALAKSVAQLSYSNIAQNLI